MSGLEIAGAVDSSNNPHSADAIMPTDKDPEQQHAQTESDISRTVPDTLVEVQGVVHKLHELSPIKRSLYADLPFRLREQIRKLVSKKGLEELSTGHRQEARMKILEAIGECSANAREICFIDTRTVGEVELSSSELEALYRRRLESSAPLEELFINNASEKWEAESWRLLADMLLRAESVHFNINNLLLSGPSKLAKAVAASGRGPLPVREVTISYGRQDLQRSEGTTERFAGKWAAHVANLIAAAPSLERVGTRIGPFPDDEGVSELIGEAVTLHQSLETLEITVQEGEGGETHLQLQEEEFDACGSEGPATNVANAENKKPRSPGPVGRLLSRAFLHRRCSTSINFLKVFFQTTPSTADLEILSQVLQMSTRITKFRLAGLEEVRIRDLRRILTKLQVNGHMHLQSLGLLQFSRDHSREWGFDRDSFAVLVELLNSNSTSALKQLVMYIDSNEDSEAFNWSGFYTSLGQMESVKLGGLSVGYRQAEKEIMEWIQGSKRLQKLDLAFLGGNISWKSVFKCLRENTALRILFVPDEALEDDAAYRELMEMLQVNSTLQEINFGKLSSKDSSRKAAVREALRGKARQGSYLAELRKGLGQAEWQSPKCGRIFLCGSPEAGKTRLTLTMLKVAKKKSLFKRVKEFVLPRTKGVEIHTLKNDNDMQILVWDLAGQDIFRALQQFLFPRLSRASVFIFVFSPFEPSGELKLKLKPNLQETFKKELLEWLRFIVSNSAITSLNLPQLIVVVSHKDIYQKTLPKMDLSWHDNVLKSLIHAFQNIIQIHPYPGQYFIDGHERQHVKPLLEKVYSIFRSLFHEKLFRVPIACSQLSQWLLQNVEVPVIDDETFFSQICRYIPDLRPFSEKLHEDASRKLLKAVVSYLHDVGTLIDMTSEEEIREMREKPKCNLMVIDPNWLTHAFLGRLISFNYGFKEVEWKGCEDGFLSGTDFEQFLFKHFKVMMEKFPMLTSKIMQDLMENLDLLYVTEIVDKRGFKIFRFFIPILFKGRGERAFSWVRHGDEISSWSVSPRKICFFGVRLHCKDQERTCLSPAFFSRFQVMIWRKLTEELKEKEPVIECKFNLISVLVDGLLMLIENDEDGDFIDVLIRSTKTKTIAWNFVEKYILEEVRELCASPKGCPGVELVMHIIRTECVKVLTPCKHRKNQSVSREELKMNFLKSIMELGPTSSEQDLYSHSWKSVTSAQLEAAPENAVELLSLNDVDECIKGNTQSLQEKVIRLEDITKEIDIDNEEKVIRAHGVQTNSLQLFEKKIFKRSKSEQLVRPIDERVETLMREIHQDLKKDFRGVERCVKEMLTEVRDLKVQIQELIHLRKREEKNLSWMYQKLDELMHMGHSVSPKEWPKKPYFTQGDVGVSHRITAVVDIGKPLMLHFKCEERGKPHIILEQPGYGITVGKKEREAWRWISQTSVKVIWYLLKAGVHISSGMGDLVPELQTSDGKTTLLTSLSMTDLLSKVQIQDGKTPNHTADTCSPENAWRFLQDFLQMNLKDQITKYFLLHPAQYCDSSATHAWLCQRCVETGLKAKILKLQKL